MEVAYCGACQHPSAIHRGARGRCRLNGCPCQGFAEAPAAAPLVELVEVPVARRLSAIVLPPAVAFIAGLVLGIAGR